MTNTKKIAILGALAALGSVAYCLASALISLAAMVG